MKTQKYIIIAAILSSLFIAAQSASAQITVSSYVNNSFPTTVGAGAAINGNAYPYSPVTEYPGYSQYPAVSFNQTETAPLLTGPLGSAGSTATLTISTDSNSLTSSFTGSGGYLGTQSSANSNFNFYLVITTAQAGTFNLQTSFSGNNVSDSTEYFFSSDGPPYPYPNFGYASAINPIANWTDFGSANGGDITITTGYAGQFQLIAQGAATAPADGEYGVSDSVSLTFTVVPEPSTWALAASGFAMLFGFQRLRRRNAQV